MEYTSVFAQHAAKVWKNRYAVTLHVQNLTGGFPLEQKVIEGWIKSKSFSTDQQMIQALADARLDGLETDLSLNDEDAARKLATRIGLKGFKRDEEGLYIEGRQVKAAIREAISVAVQGGHITETGWGKASNKKWIKGFAAEHIMVVEDRIHLNRQDADEVRFDFVHAKGMSSFKQSEVIWDATVTFTLISDFDFPADFWRQVFLIGEQQGLGADRSQSFGRYKVTQFDKLK